MGWEELFNGKIQQHEIKIERKIFSDEDVRFKVTSIIQKAKPVTPVVNNSTVILPIVPLTKSATVTQYGDVNAMYDGLDADYGFSDSFVDELECRLNE